METNFEYKRSCGVLMHISSLPSPYGIGTMGKEAYKFVDFLHDSGMSYWQLLPICPTSYGDSPYQSYCIYAGNPYFIDLDLLYGMGLICKKDFEQAGINTDDINADCGNGSIAEPSYSYVDYGDLYKKRYAVLKKASDTFFEKFIENHSEFIENRSERKEGYLSSEKSGVNTAGSSGPQGTILRFRHTDITQDYKRFCAENAVWLDSYSLFMALKEYNGGESWYNWKDGCSRYESPGVSAFEMSNVKNIEFWKITQYLFFFQWFALKEYAESRNIGIIGDLPIYVSIDSVDVWKNPELFQLDENRMPKEVSGCPPDNFSKEGQLWGNPLYDWERMERDDFKWWIRRIEYMCKIYDVLRIDHFRGFESYYAIPYKTGDALKGRWKQGPGMKIFNALFKHSGRKRIIAEDLGFLTEGVKNLLKNSGFPGMKVIEIAFDSRDPAAKDYLPHNFIRNCVAYTGTHDNDTLLGWLSSASEADVNFAKAYLRIKDDSEFNWDVIAALLATVASTCIIQAQDLLDLGSEARMNTPSTVGKNWKWRANKGDFNSRLAKKVKEMLTLYNRI